MKKTPVITEKSLKSAAKMVGKPKGVRCSECDALAYSRPLLLKHMTQIHGIEAPIMHRTFDDREELQVSFLLFDNQSPLAMVGAVTFYACCRVCGVIGVKEMGFWASGKLL